MAEEMEMINQLADIANKLRIHSIEMTTQAKSG